MYMHNYGDNKHYVKLHNCFNSYSYDHILEAMSSLTVLIIIINKHVYICYSHTLSLRWLVNK